MIIIDIDKQGQNGTTIFNILDNTTELLMTKYIMGEIFSCGGATLYKSPSDQTVRCVCVSTKYHFKVSIFCSTNILRQNSSYIKIERIWKKDQITSPPPHWWVFETLVQLFLPWWWPMPIGYNWHYRKIKSDYLRAKRIHKIY